MNDLRFAFRQLKKNPGFTLVAVLTLGLGIGVGVSVFSALDAALFRPLPYPQPDRLVELYETLPDGALNNVSGGVFLDWREHHPDFDSVALISPVTRNLQGDGRPERLSGLEATHEFLSVLGLRPILGRGFLPDEDQPSGDNRVVMISEEAWRTRFGGSASILGSVLRLDEIPHTVIGVLPRGSLPRGVWSPDAAQFVVPAVAVREAQGRYSRSQHWASVYGRLKPGVSIERADAGLKTLKLALNPEYPSYKQHWSAAVQSLHSRLASGPRPMLLVLASAVAVLLLIACANVANLLLARARNRRLEISLRAALGASPSRIVRQALTESLLLAAFGGLAGTVVAIWGVRFLGTVTSDFLPGGMSPQLDPRVLAFAVALTGATGLLFGMLPAWQARRPNLNEAFKGGGRSSTSEGRHRTQSALVISEVAMTVVLLSASGLLLRSLANAVNADPGFQPQRVLAFDLSLPETTYPTDQARFSFSQQAIEKIRTIPGVESVGTGMGIPFAGGDFGERVRRAEEPGTENDPITRVNYVSPSYLEALGTRLLAGRELRESDDRADAERVVVVNESVVSQFFPDENPVGRHLSMLGDDWRIVGVVANVPVRRVDLPSGLALYVPHVFNSVRFSFVVRTPLKPLTLADDIRREIQSLDSGLPLANVRALDDAMDASMNQRRTVLGLIGTFAAAALALACIGLYGVMSYSVAARRRELSIRVALGAQRANISGLVLREALLLAAIGSLIGLAGAVGATRLLASQLYQVNNQDPLVLGATLAVVVIVALFACWLPAWRAANVDPIEALRGE